jgi:hypothetical protein
MPAITWIDLGRIAVGAVGALLVMWGTLRLVDILLTYEVK